MKKIILLTICLLCSTIAQAKTFTTLDKAIPKIFGKTSVYEAVDVKLTDDEFYFTHVYKVSLDGQPVGYALEDTVRGKWGPIHYVVGLTDGAVVDTIVLDSKEIRGKKIAKKRYLKQYQGKTIADPLELGQDIDGISGATISSRAMTNGVSKLLKLFSILEK